MHIVRCWSRFALSRLLAAALLAVTTGVLAQAKPRFVLYPGDVLLSGQGQSITAAGEVRGQAAYIDEDGLLGVVALPTRNNPTSRTLWKTTVKGKAGCTFRGAMQSDGDFVIYEDRCVGGTQPGRGAIWHTGSGGRPTGQYYFMVEAPGHVVIYVGVATNKTKIWSSADAGSGPIGLAVMPPRAVLKAGEGLKPGEYLVSANKQFIALLTAEGNFAVRRGSDPASAKDVVFETRTQGAGASAVIQGDGNFVIYSGGKPIYNTGTYGLGAGDYTAALLDDGRFVVRGTTANKQPELWTSAKGANPEFATAAGNQVKAAAAAAKAAAEEAEKQKAARGNRPNRQLIAAGDTLEAGEFMSSANKEYHLVMQRDGALAVFAGADPSKKGVQRFSSNTGGKPAANYVAVMQDDGNLVVRAPDKSVVWNSGTGGKPAGNYYLYVLNSGQLSVTIGKSFTENFGTLWNSSTGAKLEPFAPFPGAPWSRTSLSPAQLAAVDAVLAEQKRKEMALNAEKAKAELELALTLEKQAKDRNLMEAMDKLSAPILALAKSTPNIFNPTLDAADCPAQLQGDNLAGVDYTRQTVNQPHLYDDPVRATLRTRNCLKRPVWITVYDLTKLRHLDYGCVPAGSIRDWKGGNYLAGIYFVRAEIMTTPDCKGQKWGDTAIQADVGVRYLGAAFNVDIVQDRARGNYYWDGPSKAGKGLVAGVGEAVTYAGERTGITNAVLTAWKTLAGSCSLVAQFMPDVLTQSMRLAERYGPSTLQTGAACYRQAVESFYCQFPDQLLETLSGSGGSSALTTFAGKLWDESQHQPCTGFWVATPLMPMAPMYCAMGKMVVADSVKAVKCAIAVERSGALKEFLTPHNFPSEQSCKAVGKVAFKIGYEMATKGKDKAGGTAKQMLDQFKAIYEAAGQTAETREKAMKMLQAIPDCKD